MSEERKAFSLEFEKPPKAEREGVGKQPNPLYTNTIDDFVNTKREYAKITIPKEEMDKSEAEKPLLTFKSGLASAIKRKKLDNRIKVITRKENLYLITKAYSDEQGWKWKVTRKK